MIEKIPKNWVVTTLGSITTKPQYGWTTKTSDSGSVKYLRTTDLSKGKVVWGNVPFCLEIPEDLEKYQLYENDILISRAGSVGLSFRIKDVPANTIFASYLIRFKGLFVDPRYIEYFLKTDDYWTSISNSSAGIAVQNVNAVKLSDISIPLAPLSEQKKIADKLDNLYHHLDSLNERLAKIPVLLKQFKENVLTQAVTGKLTEKWRNENNVAFDSWKIEKADQCCEKVQNGGTPKEGFSDAGVPFLKVYNIVNQEIDFEYRPQFVLSEINAKKLKKSITYPGDVLMNIVGPPLGKVAIVTEDYKEWNINQAITLFRPKKYLSNKFLYYYLCEGSLVKNIMPETKGVVGQVNISLSQCRSFDIKIPSIEEQYEIVIQIEELFGAAELMEKKYKKLLDNSQNLPLAILSKAFRGELVDQNPEDEPASALLQKITQMKTK